MAFDLAELGLIHVPCVGQPIIEERPPAGDEFLSILHCLGFAIEAARASGAAVTLFTYEHGAVTMLPGERLADVWCALFPKGYQP